MPSEYQQDYKKTRAYASKIYNDLNMSDTLRDICRTLESRYVHEGRIIYPSFYNDLSDDLVAKFTAIGICIYSDAWGLDELEKTLEQIKPYNSRLPALDDIQNLIHRRTVHEKKNKEGNTIYKLRNQIKTNEIFDHLRPCELVIRENIYSAIGNRDHTQAVIALMLYCLQNRQPFSLSYFIIMRMYFFRDRQDKVLPYGMILTRLLKNLKENMTQGSFNERYKLIPRKIYLLKAKQPKRPPPKRTRNVGKSKRTQLSTSSSSESPPLDNGDFPSNKISPRSYHRALKDDPNMSNEQRKARGMLKNLARALHNFARMLKKGNGNSFIPAAQTITNADGTSTTHIPGPITTEEKVQKKIDVKARSMLLMALPNEHLMTFNENKDAKTLFAAIQIRISGNESIKKTQKNLLKQMYENFSAPSTESLDSNFNRLQKLVSQLAILGKNSSQEDLNLKFLRSLPSKWNTHVLVWRNKPNLDTMSFDDLYNNFKIFE
uniref:Uncharacterized protein n=1 Tax=Tanacetum cinerariifolium TaxID=118510 RepID=A0A6L2J289_TANCI|nr:hypothetical protein [Tanacetum cinerariifolium]